MTIKILKKAGIPDQTLDPQSRDPSPTDKFQEINLSKETPINFFLPNQFSSKLNLGH